MDLIDQIKQAILRYDMIEKGDCIVVGVSGGPDSVCLLHILSRLKTEYKLTLAAVHINHMLRDKDADKDQEYTEVLCGKMDIPCHTFKFEVEKLAKEWKMTTEEAGRKVRYESFYKTADMVGGNKIAVAQNQNDQAETILMRLLRGTGTDGLAGIEPVRTVQRTIKIIRPLLDVSRADIEAYCTFHELNPRIDLTNAEPIYTRNKIRLGLIPYLTDNYSQNLIEHLCRLAKIAQEDKDYIYGKAEEIITDQRNVSGVDKSDVDRSDVDKSDVDRSDVDRSDVDKSGVGKSDVDKSGDNLGNNECSISKEVFCKQHPAIQKRIILRLFAQIGLTKNITALHLEKALELIVKNKTSARMDFPEGYSLQIGYDDLFFQRPKRHIEEKSKDIELLIGESVRADHFGITIQCLLSTDRPDRCQAEYLQEVFDFDKVQASLRIITPHTKDEAFDFDKPHGGLIIRSRRSGDMIAPLGMKGSKKIKEFFIDEKIPAYLRQQIPLVCVGNQVIWAVGYRISDKFKVREDTSRYLIIRVL